MAKRRPDLLYGDALCACDLETCADHTMAYGKMCADCQSGNHRKEGQHRTATWYRQFYGEEHHGEAQR